MAPEDYERLTRMRALAEKYPREFHDYAFLLRMMDERVAELLNANSQLAAQAMEDKSIVEAARKWAQSIHTLRRAMRPPDGKKGNVYGANQAYTETHLALLALMPDTTR